MLNIQQAYVWKSNQSFKFKNNQSQNPSAKIVTQAKCKVSSTQNSSIQGRNFRIFFILTKHINTWQDEHHSQALSNIIQQAIWAQKKNSKSQGASMHHWRDNMQGLWAFFPFSFSTLNLSQTLQPQKPSHTRHCSNDHQELRRSDSIRIRRKPLLEVRPNQLIYEFLRFTLSINLVYLGFFSTNFSSSPDIGSSLNQH